MNISGMGSNMDYGKIASGKRINSASDDASGLTIAKKLESQSKSLTAGAENANSSIGVTNIADGALSGVQDYLQRMKELSVKAMNGLNTPNDLKSIQKEIDGALSGIQDIAKGTEFNTMKILDGSMANMNVASNPDGTGMKIQMANSTLEALSIDGYNVTGDFDISKIDDALNKISSSRSGLGASSNGLSYTYSSNSNAALQQIGSQSKIEDLDIPQAISDKKKNEVLEDYKIMMQNKQMDQESLVTKLLQ